MKIEEFLELAKKGAIKGYELTRLVCQWHSLEYKKHIEKVVISKGENKIEVKND